MNQIIARFTNGKTIKGNTSDFVATKDRFHVLPDHAPSGTKPVEILFSDLKAIFFVKTFEGDPQHKKSNRFDPLKPPMGRKIHVVFKDGEVLMGTTQGYQPGRPGFFVIPADVKSNNERCFVISAATQEVRMMD